MGQRYLGLTWPRGNADMGSFPCGVSLLPPLKAQHPSLPPMTLPESRRDGGPPHGAQEGGPSAFSLELGRGLWGCVSHPSCHSISWSGIPGEGRGARRENRSLFLLTWPAPPALRPALLPLSPSSVCVCGGRPDEGAGQPGWGLPARREQGQETVPPPLCPAPGA